MTWTEGRIHLAMRHVLRHRGWTLLPVENFVLRPMLILKADRSKPSHPGGTFRYLRIVSPTEAFFERSLKDACL